MKPFNLEEALAGKPVVTRDGRPVTEIYHFKTAKYDTQNLLAVIDKNVFHFTKDGKYWSGGQESTADLFMASETLQVWINVWRDSKGRLITAIYLSDKTANSASQNSPNDNFIKTVPVTIEL